MTDSYGARDLVGYGPRPPHPAWPNDAKIAISIVLNYEEGSESTIMNGDKTSVGIASELGPGGMMFDNERDVNIESLYEYGSRAGVWRVLRMFDEYGIKCTSWMIGQALDMNPGVGKEMVRAGHEVASHGWRWVDRSNWTEEEEADNVKKAIDSITSTCGKPPSGWYYGMVQSKGGARSRAIVVKVFEEQGLHLKYYSDDYSDDLPYWIARPGGGKSGLLIVPYALDTNDFKDGTHNAWLSPDNFASYLIGAFDELYREGINGQPKMFSIGLHARLIGRPGRMAGLRKFFEHVSKYRQDVWYATRDEIAEHWIKTHPYEAG